MWKHYFVLQKSNFFIKPIVPYWNSNEFSHFQEPFTATVKQIPAKIRIYDQLEVYL